MSARRRDARRALALACSHLLVASCSAVPSPPPRPASAPQHPPRGRGALGRRPGLLPRQPDRRRASGRRLPGRLRRPRDPANRASSPTDRSGRHPRLRGRRCWPPTRPEPNASPRGRSGSAYGAGCRLSTRRCRSATGSSPSLPSAPASSPGASPFSATPPRSPPPPTSASPTPTLVWIEGRWRIAETRGGFGPTPKLATQPGPLGPYRVLDTDRGAWTAMSWLPRCGAATTPRRPPAPPWSSSRSPRPRARRQTRSATSAPPRSGRVSEGVGTITGGLVGGGNPVGDACNAVSGELEGARHLTDLLGLEGSRQRHLRSRSPSGSPKAPAG